MTILHTSHLLLMILIITSCDYVGSVHSMKPKFSDDDDGKKKVEDFEERDREKKSFDESKVMNHNT